MEGTRGFVAISDVEPIWGQEPRAVQLTRKAFAALRYLVIHFGQLVTKQELIAAV